MLLSFLLLFSHIQLADGHIATPRPKCTAPEGKERAHAFSIISYMAGSASFRLVASTCCAAGWLAGEDPGVEATVAGPSSRTFCWLSTFSVETHRLPTDAMLPLWLRLRLVQDDRTGIAARKRTREAPRSRGEADMVLCALVLTCKPESHVVSLGLLPVLRGFRGNARIRAVGKLTRSLLEHRRRVEEGEGGGPEPKKAPLSARLTSRCQDKPVSVVD